MKIIFLMDDDECVHTTFGHALRRSGYHVIVSDSGAIGLEMAGNIFPT
jgi:ActR/RegA family two-component response regulator